MSAISADIIFSTFPLSGRDPGGHRGALEYMDKHYFAHVKNSQGRVETFKRKRNYQVTINQIISRDHIVRCH